MNRNLAMPRARLKLPVSIGVVAFIAATTAQICSTAAQPIANATSAYTSAPDKGCKVISRTRVGGSDYASARVCKGYKNLVVYKAESDLRSAVSVGSTAEAAASEPAAAQTFGPFNYPADTVELRIAASGAPFAIIQALVNHRQRRHRHGRPAEKQAIPDRDADRTGRDLSCRLCRLASQRPGRQHDCEKGGRRPFEHVRLQNRQGQRRRQARPRHSTGAEARMGAP